MIPSDKFRFDVTVKGDRQTVVLKGTIDEDTLFEPIAQTGSPLYLNLKEVTGINSCGIRSWVNFLKDMRKAEVYYEECPPLIVRQLNMIPSFLGHAKVLSVFVPYVCDHCEKEKMLLVNSDRFEKDKGSIKESMPCEFCKEGEMELDGHPQQYFAFTE